MHFHTVHASYCTKSVSTESNSKINIDSKKLTNSTLKNPTKVNTNKENKISSRRTSVRKFIRTTIKPQIENKIKLI